MTDQLARRAAASVTVFLLVGSLGYLQVLDSQRDFLASLFVYVFVALAAILALAIKKPRSQVDLFCFLSAVGCFGYMIARALASPAVHVARLDLYMILAALVVYGLASSLLTTAGWRLAVIVPLLIFGVVHVLVSLVQSGVGRNLSLLIPSLEGVDQSPRAAGFYVNPNNLAGLLEILASLGLGITCWSRWPKWARVLVGYLTASCFLGIVLTGSRGGYLSTVASLLVFGVLSLLVLRRAGASVLLKAGGAGLLLLAAVFVGLWFLIQGNVTYSGRVDKIITDEGRIGLWHAAVEQWKLQPWTGTGSGTFLFYGRQFRPEGMQMDPVEVHNDYLHLLCEYGTIGALGFLVFLAAHLRAGCQSFARLGLQRVAAGAPPLSDRLALIIGGLSAVGAYLVHSAVDFNLHIPANALLLAFVFGIVANAGLQPTVGNTESRWHSVSKFSVPVLAIILLVQCARLLPGEYYARQARSALWDEDPAAAIPLAEKALQHERRNPHIFFTLARAQAALGYQSPHVAERAASYESALAALHEAHRLVPLDATYALDIARLYDELGRFAEAEEMFAHARTRDPRSREVALLYRRHLQAWQNSALVDPLDQLGYPRPSLE